MRVRLQGLGQPLYQGFNGQWDMAYGDLTGNGLEDIVACEFGNLTGKLTWFKNLGNNTYHRNILKTSPGAISAIIKDYNKDGHNDIFVLMAQGDEGLFYYENQGDGTFSEKRILVFPRSTAVNTLNLPILTRMALMI